MDGDHREKDNRDKANAQRRKAWHRTHQRTNSARPNNRAKQDETKPSSVGTDNNTEDVTRRSKARYKGARPKSSSVDSRRKFYREDRPSTTGVEETVSGSKAREQNEQVLKQPTMPHSKNKPRWFPKAKKDFTAKERKGFSAELSGQGERFDLNPRPGEKVNDNHQDKNRLFHHTTHVLRGEINGVRPKERKHPQTERLNIGRDQENTKPSHKVIGFPFLKGLLGQDPGHIISELTSSLPSLKDCISRSVIETDFFELFLKVISEAYMSSTTPSLMIRLYETLKENNFFSALTLYLVNNVMSVLKSEGEQVEKRVEEVLKHSLNIITRQITRNPSSTFVFRGIHSIYSQVIDDLQKNDNFDDEILSLYDHFTEQINTGPKLPKPTPHARKPEKKPPDDFRHYPISPTSKEIMGATKPFLRANRIDGEYEDLHDYLDVQFRLLREDFVGPLRDGMCDYMELVELAKENRNRKPNLRKLDIKVYENVRVQAPVVTQHGLCFKLKLQMTHGLKRMKWKFSKRLIFGSLVCLTDNDFEDFICATVVEREEKDIKHGFFVVKFEQEGLTAHNLLHKVFRMAETSGYFESYRHVLSSLQTFQDGDLPFEKYIVKCEKQVDPPSYLRDDTTYDLRPLVDTDVELHAERRLCLENVGNIVQNRSTLDFSQASFRARAVRVSDPHKWPSKELLHMDESQYKAVQTALTKEFAIIQGPPGTGKTYIGLQIVKTLLHNKTVWAGFGAGNRPMLIVCFTNHALDQFLEGIVKFFKGDVLRVGGRSSCESLDKFNMKKYRKIRHPPRSLLGKLQRTRKDAWGRLKDLTRYNLHLTKAIEIYKTEIVCEEVLQPVMGDLLYNSLTLGYRGKVFLKRGFSYILQWLEIKIIRDKCMEQCQHENKRTHKQHIEVEDDASRRLREMKLDTDEANELQKEEELVIQSIRRHDVAFYSYLLEFPGRGNNKSVKAQREARFHKLLKSAIIEKISDSDIMSKEEACAIRNVWLLDQETRWRLYRLWIKELCCKIYDRVEQKRPEFAEASEHYNEALRQEEKEIMRQASVIGMTTSGAARYQSVLRDIAPRIIVVEEAAEVLEAHIVTTLSKRCEHLILIGDHKQLRPNPTVYKLAVKYNLEISLFERMVKNGIKFNCLELQHRMRPEISCIMRHIYPDLKDHDDVKAYPNVKGISSNVFLINHTHLENSDEDIRSYSNEKEAEYAVALCRYLLLQGYEKREITVLTTYTGQLMCLRNLMPKDEFDGVKVTVVDNYQGEENEVIILSLVRSNLIEKIGFLNIENRICVALSRAKVGFYVIGNFEHLSAHSNLWKKITEEMKEKGAYGQGLKLYCQNHPRDDAIIARTPEDFKEAPEGGCMKVCDIRLKCGHKCQRFCHILDPEHKTNKCDKPCLQILCAHGHKCPEKCYKKCPPCQAPKTKIIPKCGHQQNVPCSTDPEEFSCREACEKTLSCGHPCQNLCGESHTANCQIDISCKLTCGHSAVIPCYLVGRAQCKHPCKSTLKCEHICKGTCGSCFQGKIHKPCTTKCKRILICGHECKSTCDNCPPCTARCENRCVHSRCNLSCGEPCKPCGEPCSWKCEHHVCRRLCSEPCDRPKCNKPCKKRLKKCKHACIGICGEPCPKFCRVCDKDIVTTIFFGDEDHPKARFVFLEDCQHIVESKAMDNYMQLDTNANSVQLKGCPICKTPIRKCLRYGSIINQHLQDIERVKRTLIGENEAKFQSVERLINATNTFATPNDRTIQRGINAGIYSEDHVRTLYPEHHYKALCKKQLELQLKVLNEKQFYTENQLVTLENQHRISLSIIDVILKLKTTNRSITPQDNKSSMVDFFANILDHLMKPKDHFSEQEIEDYTAEISRGNTCYQYLKLKQAIRNARKVNEAAADLETLNRLLFSGANFTNDNRAKAKSCIEKLKEHVTVDGLGISEDERLEIVKAIGLSKGHWFKCPNNHIYAIGECGGATERSKCPECKADIGGMQHRLVDGNRLATEMDGASFAAYSEEANNMANFDLNNLH